MASGPRFERDAARQADICITGGGSTLALRGFVGARSSLKTRAADRLGARGLARLFSLHGIWFSLQERINAGSPWIVGARAAGRLIDRGLAKLFSLRERINAGSPWAVDARGSSKARAAGRLGDRAQSKVTSHPSDDGPVFLLDPGLVVVAI